MTMLRLLLATCLAAACLATTCPPPGFSTVSGFDLAEYIRCGPTTGEGMVATLAGGLGSGS